MSKEMNDRDFKLLVREYFQLLSLHKFGNFVTIGETERLNVIHKRILSELELFTKKDVKELPFKD